MWRDVGIPITREQVRHLADAIPESRFVEFPALGRGPIVDDLGPVLDELHVFLTGSEPPIDIEHVLATIVFTDIVKSTEHASLIKDRRWRDLLDTHDAAVRGQLERFSGHEIKTTGDGFLALFDGPARGIACGKAIIEAANLIGLEVRVGIHTGECERTGTDVAGLAVTIAKRVLDLATPGQVLVSSTVKDLLAGSTVAFDDHGTHVLKGVPGDWRLYAVHTSAPALEAQ